MALTLKHAITDTQTTIDVDGTDTLSNGDLYTIEDEQVFITTASTGSIQPGETAWQRLGVQRGSLGTTEVAHDAGTAVTLVTTPLGAGGVQTVSLLISDPIDIATLPANLNGSPAAFIVIPAGSLLVKAFLLRTGDITHDTTSPRRLNLLLGPADDLNSGNTLMNYNLVNAYAGDVEADGTLLLEDGGDTFSNDPGLLLSAFARGALVSIDTALHVTKTASITGGACKAYALIATPAA